MRDEAGWTCRAEYLDGMIVNLQRGVRFDASEANDMVAIVIEFHKLISDDVVCQTNVIDDEHATVHLPAQQTQLALLTHFSK